MPDSLTSEECVGHMSGCHVRDGSGICPNCKQPVGPAEQLASETNVDALDNFADPNLDAYLEGFGDALDSAAITCARCASLERRIAELERAIRNITCRLLPGESAMDMRFTRVDIERLEALLK